MRQKVSWLHYWCYLQLIVIVKFSVATGYHGDSLVWLYLFCIAENQNNKATDTKVFFSCYTLFSAEEELSALQKVPVTPTGKMRLNPSPECLRFYIAACEIGLLWYTEVLTA